MLLPLYDAVYVPAHCLVSDNPTLYGIPKHETLDLVQEKKLVPIFNKRLGDYDPKHLRELLELGASVTPKALTASVTSQLLTANPLWRISQIDAALAKAHLDEIRRGIKSEAKVPDQLQAFVSRWIDYQVDGCIDLGTSYMNTAELLPLHFGPGAFLANVLSDVHGKHAPDLEARFIGLEISHAMALNSICMPRKKNLYPFYDLIALFAGAREARPEDKNIQQLPVVAQIDFILERINITFPNEIPISEWIEIANPNMEALRASLKSILNSDSPMDLESVRAATINLEKDLEKLSKGKKRSEKSANTFEIVGIISDLTALGLDLSFPGSGTLIGVVLKRAFPKLWNLMGESEKTQLIKDILVGTNSFVPPHVVRLHREKENLQKSLNG